MIRYATIVLLGVVSTLLPDAASAQARRYALTTTEGLRLHNVTAEVVTFQGKRGVRVTVAPELARRPEYSAGQIEPEAFAWIEGLEFGNGVIEAEVAGSPGEGAYPGARGFVGIAFRLQADRASDGPQAYDAFYLRPTNGRSEDQERRNHAVQYISHPDWTWSRLRRETPSRYEAYVDLLPDTWTKIRIEVGGAQARLYVHDQPQPVLIVNDVKSGPLAKGAVALWIGPGTVAHFRNLVVTP
ncbi:MAG TPA: hypothetical protein VGK75_13820 [Casimicrobiaceae bacterium]|jgi:hypothetical protein